MKKIPKHLVVLLILLLAVSLVACNAPASGGTEKTGTAEQTGSVDTESGQNEIADTSETYNSISSATTALVNALTDDQKNTTPPTDCISGVSSIEEAGSYYFSGTLTQAITVAKNAGDVHIYLENVTLSVEDDNVISSKKGAYVTVTLLGANTLSNSLGSKSKDKHVIDSKEDLVLNGTGTLTIHSTKSAIACDQTFIGLGGTVTVYAEKHAVTADSIYLNGISLNVDSCGKDVLHAESDYDAVETAPEFNFGAGFVYIENGTITTTTVLGDGIQADSFV